MTLELNTAQDEKMLLFPIKEAGDNDEIIYSLSDNTGRSWLKFIKLENNHFEIIEKDDAISEPENDLETKLNQLILDIIEAEQSGTDIESLTESQVNPYDPDKIKVSSKQFSIKLIKEMIDSDDIDLNPDFQRNFVWNSIQKSRLIESILLRIPLPMFYFSEDEEGKISVIDGLQRLTTINDFMNNKFPLRGLEYLGSTCKDRYYRDDNDKKGLDAKYSRWFNMTQISGNVIDPTSPLKVKYDIFKRINTGGKPLNNQEIRNCLAGKGLRETLKEMVFSIEFKKATDRSIKPTRMDDQEVALRFILFHRLLSSDATLENYTGYMDESLDKLTDDLVKSKKEDLSNYVSLFSNAMKNAHYLFGQKYAFRKVQSKDLKSEAHKQLINKALFVSWSVLLSKYKYSNIESQIKEGFLLRPLAKRIDKDKDFMYYLTTGTNGKANIQYVFKVAKELLDEHIIMK
ncbi:hypothetical protein EZS27_023114 [termite gut metagenome]|uniref:GmrSD restriction endonucleases N-terminal domain-containing protein n=1 Tax=termite gut metagenome TaxID=433724 RepID=A0A5J4R1D6_9ZZZZ